MQVNPYFLIQEVSAFEDTPLWDMLPVQLEDTPLCDMLLVAA